MHKSLFALGTVLSISAALAFGQRPASPAKGPTEITQTQPQQSPDLRIRQYVFTGPNTDREVKAYATKQTAGEPTAMSPSTFALVAARFKNSGGNYLLSSDKAVMVQISNSGAASTACRLTLTVSKINGVTANRQKVATIPAIPAGKDTWVMVDATSILPANVELEATSFKLKADGTDIVQETNENNNEALHNQ